MDTFYKSKWLGLNSYQESDSTQFFGRDGEVGRLVGAIDENGLCTVFGPSGAGKTSLLLAGVFPRLRRNDSLPVYLRFDHEKGAASYVSQVIETIADAVRKAGFAIRTEAPSVLPEENETLWEWFHRHLILDDCLNPIRPVLVIDQFEEIFTKGLERRGETEVLAFFTELTDLCTNNIPQSVVRAVEDGQGDLGFGHEECNWRLVVSLREDFLPRLEEISHDHPVFRKMRQPVGSFNREQALQAVCGPGGELVDETVANAIVDVVGRSASGHSCRVEPALLSLFCSRLDIARQKKGLSRITPELLAASERDILSGFYAETMGLVSDRTAELIEDQLLTSGGYRDSWAEEDAKHAGVLQSEVDTLVNARLLHVDHRGGVSWLEFSHDILTSVARASRAGRRQRRETEALQTKLRRQRAHTRRVTGLLVVLILLLSASSVAVWHFFYREYALCYLKTVKVFGRIQGVGDPLSESDKRQVAVCFRLRKHGRYSFHPYARFGQWFEKSLVYRMEAIDGRGNLTTLHGENTYFGGEEDVSAREAVETSVSSGSRLGLDDVYDSSMDREKRTPEGALDIKDEVGYQTDNAGRTDVTRDARDEQNDSGARVQSSDEQKTVCAWEFDYGRDGRPLHEVGVDREGRIIWVYTYAPCPVDSSLWRSNTIVHAVDARGFPLKQRKDEAEYVEITYDMKTGFERRFVYYNANRKITEGPFGAQCQEREYYDRGLLRKMTSKAWDEDRRLFINTIDNAGNTGQEFYYESNDTIVVSASFGLNGEPCPLASGVLTYRQEFDRFGRLINHVAYDTNLVECVDESGFSRAEYRYYDNGMIKSCDMYVPTNSIGPREVYCCSFSATSDGRLSAEKFLGNASNEVVCGEGFARRNSAYDENGVITNVELFAKTGCGGVWNLTNVHHVVQRFNAQGRETERLFYGVGDVPVSGHNNTHRTYWTYEATAGGGCKVLESYEGTNRYEVVDENGVSQIATAYDASGVQTNVDLYAPKGCGGIWNYTNVHHVVRLYDTQGNEVEQRFYGLGDVPTVGNFDVHRIGKSYATVAGESREVAEWYLDGNGEPMTNRIGVTRGTVDYNSQGRMVQLMGFAPKGRGGIMGYETAHQFVGKFNAGGDLIERSFFDESGNPVQGENNAHCTRWKYEMIAGKSRQVAEWYLDEWGREVADENGIARTATEYDADGKKTRVDLYVPKGCGGIWNCEKVHHVIRLYDAQGNETNQCFYGSGDEPVAGNNNAHRISREYNNRNEQISISYFDERLKPIQIVAVVYAAEVVDGSSARAAGVLPGDVFCEFGTYRLRDDGGFSAVVSSVQEFAQKEKHLIVARKVGDGYRIIPFKLPVGKMGIRICDKQVAGHEFEKIRSAYRDCLKRDR